MAVCDAIMKWGEGSYSNNRWWELPAVMPYCERAGLSVRSASHRFFNEMNPIKGYLALREETMHNLGPRRVDLNTMTRILYGVSSPVILRPFFESGIFSGLNESTKQKLVNIASRPLVLFEKYTEKTAAPGALW